MLNIARTRLVAASLAGFAVAAATIAFAQDASSSAGQSTQSGLQSSGQPASSTPAGGTQETAPSAQPSATNPTNLPTTRSGQTQQQSAAPVVDPNAAAKTPSNVLSQPGQQPAAQNANTPDWPAPQRYEARRGGSTATSGQGGATLGVNILSSEDGQGVVIMRVRPGTPAQQMGLEPRDRILSVNGRPIRSVDEFISAIRGMNAGDQVELSIDRAGERRNVAGRLEALREAIAAGRGPAGNIVGRAREIMGRSGGENPPMSYEEGNQTSVRNSGDIEARLSRLEQQLDRLTQEIQQLRSNANASQATAPQPAGASPPPASR